MNVKILGIGIVLFIIASASVFFYVIPALNDGMLGGDSSVACTADAKMCPDGSAVGRIGPNCEFAACPSDTSATSTQTTATEIKAHIGESASAYGVSVTPLHITEDSRCPSDVQCIWAGRVRVGAQLTSGLGTSEQIFEINTPITTESETIELIAVSPAPVSTQKIEAGQYMFTFRVTKR